MALRKFHKTIALIFSPFLLLTSVTGIILLWRKDELYSKETKNLLIGLHNWEYGAKYIGSALGLALILIIVTGLLIAFRGNKKS
jgi:hypothetical protein